MPKTASTVAGQNLLTRDQLSSEFKQQLIDDIEKRRVILPSLPDVIYKVRTAIDDPNASPASIASGIRLDTAISARLLKVANGVLFQGHGDQINRIEDAITRLGFMQVQSLVTGLAILQIMRPVKGPLAVHLKNVQLRCIEVAALAWVIASAVKHIDKQQAMMAGLVHDIGYLPALQLASKHPVLKEHPQLLDVVLHDVHACVGALVLKSWSLPQNIVDAVASHEDLHWHGGSDVDMSDILLMANVIQRRQARRLSGLALEPIELAAAQKMQIVDLDDYACSPLFQASLFKARHFIG